MHAPSAAEHCCAHALELPPPPPPPPVCAPLHPTNQLHSPLPATLAFAAAHASAVAACGHGELDESR